MGQYDAALAHKALAYLGDLVARGEGGLREGVAALNEALARLFQIVVLQRPRARYIPAARVRIPRTVRGVRIKRSKRAS